MYIRKRGDRWCVEVEVMVDYQRCRDAKTFDTKVEAMVWGARCEEELLRGQVGRVEDKTLQTLYSYASKREKKRALFV